MELSEITSPVDEFIIKSKKHIDEYSIEIENLKLFIHPEVLSPKYSYSSVFIRESWDVSQGMSVLDMGTGCGILALYAALDGASSVVALDLNTHAVDVASKNMVVNGVDDKIEVFESDLFNAIDAQYYQFDRIVFNAPFWDRPKDKNSPLTWALFDQNYEVARKFLEDSHHFLKDDGRLLLGFSAQDNVDKMKEIIDTAGWLVDKEVLGTFGHTRILFYLKKAEAKNVH